MTVATLLCVGRRGGCISTLRYIGGTTNAEHGPFAGIERRRGGGQAGAVTGGAANFVDQRSRRKCETALRRLLNAMQIVDDRSLLWINPRAILVLSGAMERKSVYRSSWLTLSKECDRS